MVSQIPRRREAILMTTSDDDARPFPDHVTEGGVPDPVVATAPVADAAPDDESAADRFLDGEGKGVFPVAGPGAGTVPPVAPR
ncbi:hypothetical protein [Cellulomonas rhizosphaerae]|uniref:Uncharacterized protein n=1 Tax=Cellulomonas rhizosphaerae TaxID=2293719 RepID=A0A413RJC5_9CELL|nr:hypothetical protein [Cellulomonas rhizosphaerae]RHA38598.1 hypothetical protein D1825_13665 [Cellulomonas rhizosphaerae]